jgi:hypothetical protein
MAQNASTTAVHLNASRISSGASLFPISPPPPTTACEYPSIGRTTAACLVASRISSATFVLPVLAAAASIVACVIWVAIGRLVPPAGVLRRTVSSLVVPQGRQLGVQLVELIIGTSIQLIGRLRVERANAHDQTLVKTAEWASRSSSAQASSASGACVSRR